jgi:cell division protein FtsL
MTIAAWTRTNKRTKIQTWNIRWAMLHILIILLSIFIYLWLGLQNIQLGYRIAEAMQVQKRLKEENQMLQLEWAHLTSPSFLQKQAEKLGLQRPNQFVKLP